MSAARPSNPCNRPNCDDLTVPDLRRATVIDVPARTVAGVLRDRRGHGAAATAHLLSVGDELRHGLGPTVRVVAVGVGGMVLRGAGVVHATTLTPTATGTTVLDEITWTDGPEGAVRDLLAARAAELANRAVALADGPVVVATALVRDGAVLAAQRTRPPALAGRWELPGGRVEPGESEVGAVVRECREELGTTVVPGGRLGTDLPIDAGVLRVHTATLAAAAPDPRALEHSGLRWVAAGELRAVDWVDADRAVVDDLVGLLGGAGGGAPPGGPGAESR